MCELRAEGRVVSKKTISDLQSFFNFWFPEI